MNVEFETKNSGGKAGKVDWYTPKYIIEGLGNNFDTDPCAAPIEKRLFDIGRQNNWTIDDDGYSKEWSGFCFVNPPYGDETEKWLKKSSEHNNCLVLIFARTETKMFHEHIWGKADAIFFFKGRISFIDSEKQTSGPAGAPSCLVAYGEKAVQHLKNCNLKGKFISLKS